MKISILGSGAYGMAMASVLHYNKHSIKMWTNSNEEANYLNANRKSPKIDYDIPSDIIISTNMRDVISDTDVIIFATPSEFVGSVSSELSKFYNNQYIAITSKGIDNKSLLCLSDVIKMNINTDLIAVISGCTFASDMVKNSILGLNVASDNLDTLNIISSILENDYLSVYKTNDVVGTEICGAVKNIMAIGSGIINGMGFSESSSAMFMTLAAKEITDLIKCLGGNVDTMFSFAGIGDLILTCNSKESRNFTLGNMIGKKIDTNDYIKNTTIEGIYTLKAIVNIAKKNNINMPIIMMINSVISGDKSSYDFINLICKLK